MEDAGRQRASHPGARTRILGSVVPGLLRCWSSCAAGVAPQLVAEVTPCSVVALVSETPWDLCRNRALPCWSVD